MYRTRQTYRFATGCQLIAVSLAFHYSLTPEADLSLLRWAFNVFRGMAAGVQFTVVPPQHFL
jgi:hypothetical protein